MLWNMPGVWHHLVFHRGGEQRVEKTMDMRDQKKASFGPKQFYSTQEVADLTGLNQTTLTLWIRNNMIDDSRIRRDPRGRRLWTRENIDMILRVKKQEGWR